jgi:hypothetical protein
VNPSRKRTPPQRWKHLFSPHTDQSIYCGKDAQDDAIETTPCGSDQLVKVPEFSHLYLHLSMMVFIDLLQSPFQSLQSRLPHPPHRFDDLRHSPAEHGCANRSSHTLRPALPATACGRARRRRYLAPGYHTTTRPNRQTEPHQTMGSPPRLAQELGRKWAASRARQPRLTARIVSSRLSRSPAVDGAHLQGRVIRLPHGRRSIQPCSALAGPPRRTHRAQREPTRRRC